MRSDYRSDPHCSSFFYGFSIAAAANRQLRYRWRAASHNPPQMLDTLLPVHGVRWACLFHLVLGQVHKCCCPRSDAATTTNARYIHAICLPASYYHERVFFRAVSLLFLPYSDPVLSSCESRSRLHRPRRVQPRSRYFCYFLSHASYLACIRVTLCTLIRQHDHRKAV